ncbi:MAG: P-II family nitrogen regulator [Cyanobacteria bacterium P01_G01_bin.39]
MKKVEAIIHSYKLDNVKSSLVSAGVIGMSISEIKAFGHQKGAETRYRGQEYRVDFTTKIKVEVVVEDEMVDLVTQQISLAARTGEIGDGKIFVSNISETVRIRTQESGVTAI